MIADLDTLLIALYVAAQRRGSVKVLVQSTGAGTCSAWGICAAAWPFLVFPGSVIFEA
jgi:hypothetical protein